MKLFPVCFILKQYFVFMFVQLGSQK